MHTRRTRTGSLARCARRRVLAMLEHCCPPSRCEPGYGSTAARHPRPGSARLQGERATFVSAKAVSRAAPRQRGNHGIHVFFRAPPGGAGDFLLRGQEKSHQREGHPANTPSAHPCAPGARATTGVRRRHVLVPAANWRTSCAPSFGHFRRPLTVFEGPRSARIVRARRNEACCRFSRRTRPWMAGIEAEPGAVGSAAAAMPGARERHACLSTRMCEFAPARDRRAARAVERTRRSFDHRLRRHGLWLLSAKTESSPLAAEASGTRYGRRELGKTGFRVRPFGSPRNDGESRVQACAGMTACSRIGTARCRCAP